MGGRFLAALRTFDRFLTVSSVDGEKLTFNYFSTSLNAMEKPQIIAHVQKSLNFTLFESRWIPCSAKFVILGNHPRGTGALQVYEVAHGDVKLLHDVEKS